MVSRIEAAVGELLHRRGWRRAFTVAEMVGRWAVLVEAVERGYPDGPQSYVEDLDCRNWLHEAWLLLDHDTMVVWNQRIKDLDLRFVTATVYDDGAALGRLHPIASDALWWWRRHPRLLTGPLGRALGAAEATGADPGGEP
ncbi:hypothetical protein [Streptomyces hoynatensis]|uniref:Uncharacterized protein n=1 Tax=Streptomyces hoynatensis TaxID=1141874 RepID=A0A3A9ZEV1_9ACTN|nr:hypothetical protein [Streptomyces hoynatensis]RKN46719.1 hypothetical protein D7294_00370 [Streptomyces hoynatensis]